MFSEETNRPTKQPINHRTLFLNLMALLLLRSFFLNYSKHIFFLVILPFLVIKSLANENFLKLRKEKDQNILNYHEQAFDLRIKLRNFFLNMKFFNALYL